MFWTRVLLAKEHNVLPYFIQIFGIKVIKFHHADLSCTGAIKLALNH